MYNLSKQSRHTFNIRLLSNTVLPEPDGAGKIQRSGNFGTISCLDCIHVYSCSLICLIIIASFIDYNIDLKLLSNIIYIYMWVIAESITAGLILKLINNYISGKHIFENCMNEQEDEYNEMVSVSTSILGSSSIHHVHV